METTKRRTFKSLSNSDKVNELRFSFFYDKEKGMFTTIPNGNIDLERLIEIYQSDFIKDLTDKIRNEQDEKIKKELKKQLPFITPYSVFDGARQNINQTHFNQNLLCLDIDGLIQSDVEFVKMVLTLNPGTILCAVSPRGKGIKALVLISDIIPKENAYNVLKLNLNHIADSLGLKDFVNKIDLAQFKPTQPWFINFDQNLYVNKNPILHEINLITIQEPVYYDCPKDFDFLPLAERDNYKAKCTRIDLYIDSIVIAHEKFFACLVDGKRHSNIIKVQFVASIIHYAEHLEAEVKERLLNACIRMYGTENEAKENNVYKSFEKAWEGAKPKINKTIELILEDEGKIIKYS
jgi:hypothetical protein